MRIKIRELRKKSTEKLYIINIRCIHVAYNYFSIPLPTCFVY